MKNEFLYTWENIKTYQKAQKQVYFDIPKNYSNKLIKQYQNGKRVEAQEIYIFSSKKEHQSLEEQLDGINNYELSYMRFF